MFNITDAKVTRLESFKATDFSEIMTAGIKHAGTQRIPHETSKKISATTDAHSHAVHLHNILEG